MTPIEKIDAARTKIYAAQNALTKAVKSAFPEGCTVSVRLGNAHIVATVRGHGTNHNAGYLNVQNQRTGKERSFHVLCDVPTRLGV